MLEALVRKSDGTIILVRDPDSPWGNKERGEGHAPFYVVQLYDNDVEKKHKKGRVTMYPYAEWSEKEVNMDPENPDAPVSIEHDMEHEGLRVVPEGKEHMDRVTKRELVRKRIVRESMTEGTKPPSRIKKEVQPIGR